MNAYLSVPVSVGEIDFSLFRKFPYATVDLAEVKTKGSHSSGRQDPLLLASHIFFQFSWWDIFGDHIRLKRISVEDAVCFMYTDETGNRNYDIFKKTQGSQNAFNLELDEIILKNTAFRYLDIQGGRDYSLRTEDMHLKGLFSSENYELSGEGPLFVERFSMNGVNYLSQKETRLKVQVTMNTREGLYTIRESTMQIASLDLGIDGFIRSKEGRTSLDLSIKSRNAGLDGILSLIPGIYKERLQQYEYKGEVYFDVHIAGESGGSQQPLITAAFGTENAMLKPSGTSYTLKNIRFKGNYTNRISSGNPTERLTLDKLEASLENQPLKMSLTVEDFSNPYIQLLADARLNLQVLSRFYLPDTISEMNGELRINARIKGRAKSTAGWISEGHLQASGVSFKLKQKEVPFTGFNGDISLRGNRLQLTNMSGKAAGSDFRLNGYFDNVYAFLLSGSEVLMGEATLLSDNLDLNELLEDHSGTAADSSYRLDISNRIRVQLGVNIGLLSFRKFQAWQTKGIIQIRDKVLSSEDISFKAFEGHLKSKGRMDASRPDSVLIACDADVKKLDVTELFTQLGNFGQDVIRDENVRGKLTAQVQFVSVWSKDLHCNLNRIYAKSKLLIENGELNNFQPMLLLSKYLKSADLKQIRFESLENEIEISNKTIHIPAMEIKSSVMDLTAMGTHTFNNVIDYKLQLYLSQLFGKKVRNNNTEFGTIEDDGLGRMRLFLTMKGPLANPAIMVDRKGLEQKVTKTLKEEKQDLKVILNKEFGWFRKDTSVVKKTDNQSKKQEELELETDPE